jgi:hypothetical protein
LVIGGQDQEEVQAQFLRTQVLEKAPEAMFDKGEAAVNLSYPTGVQQFFVDHGRLPMF